jgi:hypothetical protein
MRTLSITFVGRIVLAAALATLSVAVACYHRPPQLLARCTSRAHSSIAWRQRDGGLDLIGRVVRLDGTTPVPNARIIFEPGPYSASTRTDGSFQLAVPAGVYQLRGQSLGSVEAHDSLVLTGRNGVQILVTLVEPDLGLREC